MDLVGNEKVDEEAVELRGPGVGWLAYTSLKCPKITI